jgi:endonuclease-3
LNVEEQLTENIPPELMSKAHHWLILHGRYVCKARKPLCSTCGLKSICEFYILNEKKSKKHVRDKIN